MAASQSLVPALSAPNPRTTPALARRQANSRPDPSPTPSAEQAKAISTLLPFHELEVIAWLTFARSIDPGFQYRPGAGHLTQQQLHALSFLSSAPDKDVKAWLGLGHRLSGSVHSDRFSQCSTLAESRLSSTSSLAADAIAQLKVATCAGDSVESINLDHTNFHHASSTYLVDKGPLNVDKPVPLLPPDVQDGSVPRRSRRASTGKDDHFHWVTSQEHDHAITCGGFKRHEKEQERHWVFMPSGPIEDSLQGPRCALCPTLCPDKEHLKFHGILDVSSNKCSTKKSREGDFKKLLKAHQVPDHYIDNLVDKWLVVRTKKAYSCGFCIGLFKSLSERTNHLCHEHFHRGQNMDRWHITNLIRGLLLQPEINREYRALFGLDPSKTDSRRAWRSSSLKDLQSRLELGEESPRVLAEAAYNAARYPTIVPKSHQIVEAGLQIPSIPDNVSTSLIAANHDLTPPLPASAPSSMGSTTATPTFPDTMDLHQQHMKRDPEISSDLYAAQINVDWTANLPVRSDSLNLNPFTHTQAASHGTESLFENQPLYVSPTQSKPQENHVLAENITNEDTGNRMPSEFADSFISDSPEQPWPGLLASDFIDSYLQNTVQDSEYNTDDALAQSSAIKRKLSAASAAVANNKAQTASPMNFQHGTNNISMLSQ